MDLKNINPYSYSGTVFLYHYTIRHTFQKTGKISITKYRLNQDAAVWSFSERGTVFAATRNTAKARALRPLKSQGQTPSHKNFRYDARINDKTQWCINGKTKII